MSKASNREHALKRNQCYRGNGYRKAIYIDFLQALMACERMRVEGSGPLTVYECFQCRGIHVGHLGKGEAILMYGPYAEDVRKLQGFAA